MRFRCFRKVDTKEWVDVLFTVDGDEFSVPEESHRTDIALALGVPAGALETVEANSDQRRGTLLLLPTPAEDPINPTQSRILELLAIPRSDWTTAQLRELVELTARRAMS